LPLNPVGILGAWLNFASKFIEIDFRWIIFDSAKGKYPNPQKNRSKPNNFLNLQNFLV